MGENMEQLLQQLVSMIQNFVATNNMVLSVSVGVLAILIESIIPALPLAVFIAINIVAFGNIVGFIISWLATCAGCSISFWIFRKFREFFQKKLRKESKILSFVNKIDTIKFSSLVLILAMPFTPAFSINIAAGISNMKYKKYLIALLISKVFIVYFWGYVGSNVLTNITDIGLMIKLLLIGLILYVLSKVVTKKFDL